ncbi:transcriptional regulator (WYL domain) [Campylobacter mucosalis]|nr:transcriptional regulator (WYL domain) [Campylobacter mucosalis]
MACGRLSFFDFVPLLLSTTYKFISLSYSFLKCSFVDFASKKLRDRPHTIAELSNMLGVSTKTVQRDLYETLVEYGAVKNGHLWSIDDKSANDGLDGDDRVVLNILDNVAKNMGASFYGKAHVLLTQISEQLNHSILTNINNEKLGEQDLANFQILEDAVRDRVEIKCVYNDYEFCVKPLKLALFEGFWYLLLLDSKKGDTFKKFHLKSIRDIRPTKNKFEISDELENRVRAINSAWASLEKPETARLLLDKKVVKYFERKRYINENITGKDKDGSVEMEIDFTHVMQIKLLICYYIPFIKVLSPKWLADEIKKEIKEYVKQIDV